MLRRIIAVVLAVVGGGMVVSYMRRWIMSKYPLTTDPSIMDKAAFIEFVQNLPDDAFLMILASHGLGALFAAFIAAAI